MNTRIKDLRTAIGHEKPHPMPPKYLPKLRFRIGNDRTKAVVEFTIDLPLEGYAENILTLALEKFRDVMSLLSLIPKPSETDNGTTEKETPGPAARDQE